MGLFSGGNSSIANYNIQQNKTATGEGINLEGDNNTFNIERADANALIATADSLYEISKDSLGTAAVLGLGAQAGAVELSKQFTDAAVHLGDNANGQALAVISANNESRSAELDAQQRTISEVTETLKEAKQGDAAVLASTVNKTVAVVSLAAVLLTVFKKK